MAEVEFVKGPGRRYRSLLHRADGTVVEFEGGAWNRVGGPARELPHDLAHLIVEDALGLRRGVWGVLAAGGMFRHATVVAGRRRPHATRRGREVVDASRDEVMRAELVVRAVCDLAAGTGTGPPGPAWPAPVEAAALTRAVERLQAAAVAWRDVVPGDRLTTTWHLT